MMFTIIKVEHTISRGVAENFRCTRISTKIAKITEKMIVKAREEIRFAYGPWGCRLDRRMTTVKIPVLGNRGATLDIRNVTIPKKQLDIRTKTKNPNANSHLPRPRTQRNP
jgi:hypothetical protein